MFSFFEGIAEKLVHEGGTLHLEVLGNQFKNLRERADLDLTGFKIAGRKKMLPGGQRAQSPIAGPSVIVGDDAARTL